MSNARTLLLSLRPRFAEAILQGRKTIEIRRRPVNAGPGTPVILYSSSPAMAVVGTAQLAQIEVEAAPVAWRRYRTAFGLSRAEYDIYVDGVSSVYLLHLTGVNTLNEPLPLRDLREEGPFQPPQSFRYLAESDPALLRKLVPAA
ncbi:hypothetical protein FXF53_28830 [Micromonospora sp. WP24]|uniref:hypothetical protein n=1 Tax=Micromonospora sp. WP24 TaxID=2604469 RepID=UPI0011DAFF9F|nr:hypothetical protein [Micromonospora sp. WP24]TYB92191.1 hypothetical protein FXF53_28830 [Micromonospora sp. WP24]